MTPDQITRDTVAGMYRMIRDYRGDLKGRYGTLDAIFNATRKLPYRRDVDYGDYNRPELLKRPAATLRGGGDCDCKAIFAGSALANIGIPFHIVTTSDRPDREFNHTFLEIDDGGDWIPFDATYSSNTLGLSAPFTRKKSWLNPMKLVDHGSYSTLEGSLGQITDIASLLANVNKLTDTLKSLPIFGALFKGKTQHIDYDVCRAKQKEVRDEIGQLWDGLGAEGQKLLYALSQSYFNNYVLAGFGSWWGGFIREDARAVQANPDVWNKPREYTGYALTILLFAVLFKGDASTTENDVPNWYTNTITARVWNPINDYIALHGGTAKKSPGGVPIIPPPIDAGLTSSTGKLIAAGAGVLVVIGAVAMMFGKKKRGQR